MAANKTTPSWISENAEPAPELKKYPNEKAQRRIDQKTKPQLGRKKDSPDATVEIEIKEVDRIENLPVVMIKGTGRRNDVKYISLPIPIEDYERIKTETSNVSASFIALIKYALSKLDEEKKILIVNHIKHV